MLLTTTVVAPFSLLTRTIRGTIIAIDSRTSSREEARLVEARNNNNSSKIRVAKLQTTRRRP